MGKERFDFCPNKESEWISNSVLTPQPFLLNEEVIRVYASFRDEIGIGHRLY
ncbi:hypothetical protein UXU46_04175 [Campylobacter jejuni]